MLFKEQLQNLMTGIQYLTDEKGKPTSVLIDLKKWGKLWEDFSDAMIIKQRKNEPRESLASVKRALIKSGKINA
jgi:hypothetical protein